MAQTTVTRFDGHTIDRSFPSGLYSAYVTDRFLKADTLCGMLDTLGGDREDDVDAYAECHCEDCDPEDEE
jgi:hypothetical protein